MRPKLLYDVEIWSIIKEKSINLSSLRIKSEGKSVGHFLLRQRRNRLEDQMEEALTD